MSRIQIYTSVGPRIEAFVQRHRNETLCIATGFLSPNVDRAIRHWSPRGVRLLVGLDPRDCRVAPGLARCLQRLRNNQTVDIRCLAGLHAKLYLAPGKEAVVASANLSQSGFERLQEVAAQTDDPRAVSQAERRFAAWWKKAVPLRLVIVSVAQRNATGEETPMGLGLPSTYSSSFRNSEAALIPSNEPSRSTEEVIEWLVSAENRPPFISFFAAYIAALPAKNNRWELTQSNYFFRLNVGPLTCLDAAQGTIGIHVRRLSSSLRRDIERIGGTVARGQKASKWFTPGALWVQIPIDRIGQHANKLLPEAAAFAQSVTRRTSWMYAHSASAVDYFSRQSGRVLPDPRIDQPR